MGDIRGRVPRNADNLREFSARFGFRGSAAWTGSKSTPARSVRRPQPFRRSGKLIYSQRGGGFHGRFAKAAVEYSNWRCRKGAFERREFALAIHIRK